jgi:FixJ family two-component response regulator
MSSLKILSGSTCKKIMTRQVVAIVDDDVSFLGGLKRLLTASHFTTEFFNSAEELLTCDHIDDIACIVLDIHLKGMSGLEARRRLSAKDSKIPVIFMTAHDGAAIRKGAMEAGCAAFLTKPFSGNILIDVIRNAMTVC